MENILKSGIIDQPICYNDYGDVEFIVNNIFEDDNYIHIKGETGYLNRNLESVSNGEISIKLSSFDGTNFYFKYNKKKHIIEIEKNIRYVTCEEDEYKKYKESWYYSEPNYKNDIHFPYLRLPRSKDCVIIPHLVKAFWKGDNTPKILINVNNEE
jgi:hypothetical protein